MVAQFHSSKLQLTIHCLARIIWKKTFKSDNHTVPVSDRKKHALLVDMNGLTATDNPFILHLLKNRQFVHQKDKQGNVQNIDNATHYLMDGCRGGVVIIAWDDYHTALEAYANSIESGFKVFMIEKRTKVFKSLGDIDYKSLRPLTELEEMGLFLHIQECHKMFYPEWKSIEEHGDVFQMWVLSTSTDLVGETEDKKPLYKSGNHLIFPNDLLTDSEADWIHKTCVVKARQKWPTTKHLTIQEDWDKIIDRSVIDSNGLRMVGSRKVKKCPECKGAKSKFQECSNCNFSGRLDCGRPYMLKYIINSNGKRCLEDEAFYKSNFTALSRRVSIRTNQTTSTPGFKPYAGAPANNPHVLQVGSDGKLVSVSQGFAEDNKAQSRMREKNRLPRNDHLIPIIQRIVRKFSPAYSKVEVDTVFTNDKRDAYRINLCGEGSQTCGNLIGRDHHNNSAYMRMEKVDDVATIQQRCYCQCKVTTGRLLNKFGVRVFCGKYGSDKKRVSEEESDDCYPTFLTKVGSIMKTAAVKSVFNFDPNPNGPYKTLSRIVRICGAKVMEHLSGEVTYQGTGGGAQGVKKRKAPGGEGGAGTQGGNKRQRKVNNNVNNNNGNQNISQYGSGNVSGSQSQSATNNQQCGGHGGHGDSDSDHEDHDGHMEHVVATPAVKKKREMSSAMDLDECSGSGGESTPHPKTKKRKIKTKAKDDDDAEVDDLAPWVSVADRE